MKKVDLKISLILAFICLIGGFFLVPYQLEMLQNTSSDQYDSLIKTIPIPIYILSMISSLQIAIFSFVLSFIGIKLARKVGFKLNIFDSFFSKEKTKIDLKSTLMAVGFGVITAFVLVGADQFYFQHNIEAIGKGQAETSVIGLLAGIFYGGVFEEIMLRLFFMSLLVWLMMKLFRRNQQSLSNSFFWIAIVIASLLFAAGHLPATVMVFGDLTVELIIRCFLLNGIGGIFFGYLYWKKGFEYAVLAHMFTHIALQLLFIPLLS
ncbi:CPBP family intramembrane glutamic endopeptidase [Lysinibacillus halotolerans]|uniref:CPBP family intramembrane glutamic endopeptidase n=1 Tax=Ureibacillus sp. FSL E2-3493 TaxID=2921367 RepID=UPI00311A0D3A